MPVNAVFLNLFVNQVRPRAVAFEKWAGRMNEVAKADPNMSAEERTTSANVYGYAKAALESCNELATDMGVTFPE